MLVGNYDINGCRREDQVRNKHTTDLIYVSRICPSTTRDKQTEGSSTRSKKKELEFSSGTNVRRNRNG